VATLLVTIAAWPSWSEADSMPSPHRTLIERVYCAVPPIRAPLPAGLLPRTARRIPLRPRDGSGEQRDNHCGVSAVPIDPIDRNVNPFPPYFYSSEWVVVVYGPMFFLLLLFTWTIKTESQYWWERSCNNDTLFLFTRQW
jgi:hypothetical protein